MNHAALDRSERLQRVLAVLADGEWKGTRLVMEMAHVCAVSAVISEIRANGIAIECRCIGRGRFEYRIAPRLAAKPAPTEQLVLLEAAA